MSTFYVPLHFSLFSSGLSTVTKTTGVEATGSGMADDGTGGAGTGRFWEELVGTASVEASGGLRRLAP